MSSERTTLTEFSKLTGKDNSRGGIFKWFFNKNDSSSDDIDHNNKSKVQDIFNNNNVSNISSSSPNILANYESDSDDLSAKLCLPINETKSSDKSAI